MKNFLITAGFVFSMMLVGNVLAQTTDASQGSLANDLVEEIAKETGKEAPTIEIERSDAGTIKLDIDFDDDYAINEESIDTIGSVIRKVAGDEVADEVVIELKGLSDEEKKQLSKSLREGLPFDGEKVPGWVGAVAILAVILIFGSPIIVLIAVFFFMGRKRKQKMNIIQVYLDAGKDVPPELIRTFESGGGSFKSGVLLAGAGLGIVAAFNAANEPSVAALGLIPLFIGIAKLLYWFFEERKYNSA